MSDKNVVPQEPTREQAELIAKTFRDQSNELLYIIAHPETPAPHKDDFTPECIEPLL